MNNPFTRTETPLDENDAENEGPWRLLTPSYTADQKARLDALNKDWLDAPSVPMEEKIVQAVMKVMKENARRKWIAENFSEPKENFPFPSGADLPMVQNNAQGE